MALLEVQDLQTYFRTTGEPRRVVDGVSFSLNSGETLGVVGESGCGKSLTALSIMRLLPPPGYIAGGNIQFDGKEVTTMGPDARRDLRGRHVAMIFQEPMTSLNPVLSVQTQLLEAVRRQRQEDGTPLTKEQQVEQALEALRLVEMPDPERRLREFPHQMSGGMLQRVMIAMALACRPEMLIADEPTTALDVTVEARILDLLKDIQKRVGTAILFITHDLAVVSKMAHRVAVMYAGKIVEMGSTTTVFQDPYHPYTQQLLRCRPTRVQRGYSLETIEGVVPNPKDYPTGCRFCDRCPNAFEPCRNEPPVSTQIAPGHVVSCHLYDEQSRAQIEVTSRAGKEDDAVDDMKEELLLDAREVVKYFPIRKGIFRRVVGHVKAVDHVDLPIRRGSTVALVGESGCGKTTLGKTLIRLLPATSGEIGFEGRDLMELDDQALQGMRSDIQIVFQDPYSSLNPRMMVQEIVEEGMRVHGIGSNREERHAQIRELLKKVGLKPESMTSYPHEFSGGQRQRIGIARALAVQPKFIILDEPTSALDVSIQAQILNLLGQLQGHGEQRLTYLFITHDLGVVEYVADEVAVMYLGRIVERNRTEELFDNPRHPYTKALLSAIPEMEKDGTGKRIRLEGDVPSPSNPPQGCHFHPRCPEAMPVCSEKYPAVTNVGECCMVRCHLHNQEPVGE